MKRADVWCLKGVYQSDLNVFISRSEMHKDILLFTRFSYLSDKGT